MYKIKFGFWLAWQAAIWWWFVMCFPAAGNGQRAIYQRFWEKLELLRNI